jgi:prevent-host-death family protein
MKSIGLRELKDHLSKAISEVEHGKVLEITKRGRVVARIIPVTQVVSMQERRAIIESLDNLAAEIGKHTRPSNVAETISEFRR